MFINNMKKNVIHYAILVIIKDYSELTLFWWLFTTYGGVLIFFFIFDVITSIFIIIINK